MENNQESALQRASKYNVLKDWVNAWRDGVITQAELVDTIELLADTENEKMLIINFLGIEL